MGLAASDFQGEAQHLGLKYYYGGRMTQSAIYAVYNSLGPAVTADNSNLADVTLRTPAPTLALSSWTDELTRELKLLINKGRNSVGPTQMGSILSAIGAGGLLPPVNTVAPVVSAPGLSVAGPNTASTTNGTWTNTPTTYGYQWLRTGSPIFNANNQTHLLVAADQGFMLSCMVTAYNADGSGTATSNQIGPVTA
jgi:hypothetical protein